MSSATSKDIFNTAPDVAESLITDCIGHLHSVFGDIVLEPLKTTPEDSVILAKFWERKAKEVSFGQSRNVPFGQSRNVPFGQSRNVPFGQSRSSSSVSSSDLSLRSSLFQPISPSGQSPTFQSVPAPVINTINDYAPISIKSASGTTTGELEMKHITYDKAGPVVAAAAAPSGGTPVAPAGGAQVVAPAIKPVVAAAVRPAPAPAPVRPAAAPVRPAAAPVRPAVAPAVAQVAAPALPIPPVNTTKTEAPVLTEVEPPPPPSVAQVQVPNLQIKSSVSNSSNSTPSSTSRSSTLFNSTAAADAKKREKYAPSNNKPFRGGDE